MCCIINTSFLEYIANFLYTPHCELLDISSSIFFTFLYKTVQLFHLNNMLSCCTYFYSYFIVYFLFMFLDLQNLLFYFSLYFLLTML